MKLREYCCCAIPTVNAGMYVALAEQMVLGAVVGGLSFSPPEIVGDTSPDFANIILGSIALLGAVLQFLGIAGVAKQSTSIVKRFVGLHLLVLIAGFGAAAAWIIMSATGHDKAKSLCEQNFFDTSDDTQKDLADRLCEIFPWVDVGVMGGLWVLLAALQLYLYVVMLSYSSYLQDAKGGVYGSLETIPMKDHTEAWDTRGSTDHTANSYYSQPAVPNHNNNNNDFAAPQQHFRSNSTTSMSDVMSEPARQPRDGYNNYETPDYPHAPREDVAPPVPTTYQGGNDYGRPAHAENYRY